MIIIFYSYYTHVLYICYLSNNIFFFTNNRLFTDKICSVIQVVDKIKSITFMWLKARFITLPFNLHGWWLSPFTMLDIG